MMVASRSGELVRRALGPLRLQQSSQQLKLSRREYGGCQYLSVKRVDLPSLGFETTFLQLDKVGLGPHLFLKNIDALNRLRCRQDRRGELLAMSEQQRVSDRDEFLASSRILDPSSSIAFEQMSRTHEYVHGRVRK
ncbi:hypothetical protein AeMF1_007467 [Aphanomyces euteiches]|nr:hypothetical protein AeMF1_007467 [Aphanomyces euteiches]